MLVKVDGLWDNGNWCRVVGGSYDDSEQPPLGADVLVFFIRGNQENPCCIPGSLIPSEVSTEAQIASDADAAAGEGDVKVYEDGRIRVVRDARRDSYAIRISDAENDVLNFLDIDFQSGQVGITAPLGIVLRSPTGSVRIEGAQVEINGRKVSKRGGTI